MDKSKYCNAKNIKKELDDYVMGQEKGIRTISAAIAQHIQQNRYYWEPRELLQTDNILLIGPTGCGKTETFRVLQKLEDDFRCPVVMFNVLDYAATKTWQGDAITTIFDKITIEAVNIYRHQIKIPESFETVKRKVIEIANHAIVLIDEFDKIALSEEGRTRSFLKEYQSNLLKIIEGNIYPVTDLSYRRQYLKKNEDGTESKEPETVILNDMELDTTNMMFIFLGAFEGIQEITKHRLWKEKMKKVKKPLSLAVNYQDTHLGFMITPGTNTKPKPKDEEYTYEQLIPSQEDIIRYGFMRELVGRIPVRTVYVPLTEESLVDILLHSKTSAYKKYQIRFKQNGHTLRCNKDALREIARITVERGTGARGMMNVFSELLQDTQFELSGNPHPIHCLLRGKEIRKHKPPLLRNMAERKLKNWKKKLNHKHFIE